MIFLDMDDTFVDLRGAVYEKFGRPDPYKDGSFTGWDFIAHWGLHPDVVFDQLDSCFWATIPPLPWASDLIRFCEARGPVWLLTSLPQNPVCASAALCGKMLWIERFMPDYVKRVAFARDKSFAARPGATLIDDHYANCIAFSIAGGRSLVFPRPWNSNHNSDWKDVLRGL